MPQLVPRALGDAGGCNDYRWNQHRHCPLHWTKPLPREGCACVPLFAFGLLPPFRAATNAAAAADAGRHPPERQRYGSADAQTWQNGVRAGENCRTAEKSGDDEREYYHRASLAAA